MAINVAWQHESGHMMIKSYHMVDSLVKTTEKPGWNTLSLLCMVLDRGLLSWHLRHSTYLLLYLWENRYILITNLVILPFSLSPTISISRFILIQELCEILKKLNRKERKYKQTILSQLKSLFWKPLYY